ncbi:MAG: 4'-phosphopantetheinyl transferase superfamily protein [Anaeromyxobacter sp.]
MLEALASQLRQLLPEGVACAVEAPVCAPERLLGEELAAVAGVIPKRCGEFVGGRVAARAALAALGVAPVALPPGPQRAPLWPAGLSGSISHASDVCVAVAARAERFAALGVDVEGAAPLDPKLWRRVLTPEEQAQIEAAPEDERGGLAKLVFSLKEATYKCQHPLTGRFLGFQEVVVRWDPGAGAFEARVLAADGGPTPAMVIRGRYARVGEHLVSVALIPVP